MKNVKKLMLMSVAFLSLAATGCNGGNNGNSSSYEPDTNEVSVFILTGQSNMEGNTRFTETNLNQVFTDLEIEDGQVCFDGIKEVQTSFYGCGYGQIYTESNVHASNTEAGHKIDGKFLDTKTGMGNSDSSIGPELGAAYVIREQVDEEKPVFFIKCGVSGSGFDQKDSQGPKCDWNVEKDESLYSNILKPYTQNCLGLIEDAGFTPVIKAFLWNQGESDADEKKIPYYNDRFDALVDLFKTDFEEYAPDQEKDDIAVIDALIYEKNKPTTISINDEKLKNVARHDNYYYVDATEREGGIALTMGGDNLHYDLKSIFRLGMAYGQAILDNNLLD
ncbi:MAG: sialate O-acetylesterase [Bacilli bacterium]|nr:sialate O-acetylesterase [Bacilli bacterium]